MNAASRLPKPATTDLLAGFSISLINVSGFDEHCLTCRIMSDCQPVETHMWIFTASNAADIRTVICNTVASGKTRLTYMMAGQLYKAIRELIVTG